jgi:hypothetical protein
MVFSLILKSNFFTFMNNTRNIYITQYQKTFKMPRNTYNYDHSTIKIIHDS